MNDVSCRSAERPVQGRCRRSWPRPAAVFAVMACVITPGVVSAEPELSGTADELRRFLNPEPALVSIRGEGELTAHKDVAKVSLLVSTEARELASAMGDNERIRAQLIDRLTAGGIAGEDISNANFSSSPQAGWFGRGVGSFEVSARMEVAVTSAAQLQRVAAAADDADAVVFEQVAFEHSEEKAFELKAKEMALADVMEQKAFYEKALGLQLKVVNFHHDPVYEVEREIRHLRLDRKAAGAATEPAAPVSVPGFDEVVYRTSVTVVFELVPD